MPTYSYKCTECGTAFDIQQAFTDDSLTECPNCGGKLRKVFSAVGVSFNGSGFYRNDSRAAEKGGAKGAGAAGAAGSSGSSGSSSESSAGGSSDSSSTSSSSSSNSSGGSSSAGSTSQPAASPTQSKPAASPAAK